jgi:large subunit ribosomal protein L24
MKLKKGDNVIVIAGKHKGEKGKLARVNRETERVVIEGVGSVTRHVKAKGNAKGSIVKGEASIHASNVKLAK